MSLGIYPEFKPELKSDKFDCLGESLAFSFQKLDQITAEVKLTPFSAFADNRPVPEDFDGDPEALLESMGEWNEWFDPAFGRDAIGKLVEHIKATPKAKRRLKYADAVVAELEELVRVLDEAVNQGVKFRLRMS